MQLNHGLLVVLSLCLSSSVDAAPASTPSLKGRSFSVERQHNHKHVRNGPAALQRAMSKYGFDFPIPPALEGLLEGLGIDTPGQGARPSQSGGSGSTNDVSGSPTTPAATSAAAPSSTGGQNGEVAASPEANDAEYLAPVTIGGQKLNLDFDTGSSDLWIFNTQLSQQQTSGHGLYDSSKSSTFQKLQGASFQIQYGDNSEVQGNVGTDSVSVGGATVQKQAIELATDLSGSFATDTDNDGLLGLAFSAINTVQPQQQKTFFDNVKEQLDQPVFTAALKHATPGSYDFGTIDQSKFTGDIAYTSVDSSNGLWEFTPAGITVNGRSVGSDIPAIADTGTSLLLMDDSVVDAYYKQVQGAQVDEQQGGYTFPCDADLPDLPIAITDSYTANISGSLLNFAPVDGQTCFGGLQSNAGQSFQILGDPLFKSQFVVFDAGKTQLGFAAHA